MISDETFWLVAFALYFVDNIKLLDTRTSSSAKLYCFAGKFTLSQFRSWCAVAAWFC